MAIIKKRHLPRLFLRAVLMGGVLSFGAAAEAPGQDIDLAVKRLQAAGPHYRRGLNEFELGDLKKAETAFSQCIQEMPDHADALYYLANLSYLRKEYSQAKDYMEQSLSGFPIMQELTVYASEKKVDLIDSQRETLERLWNSTNSCRDSREIEFAWNQLDKQESDQELAAGRRRAMQDRLKAHYLYFSGNIFFQLRQVPKAFERYQSALDLDPGHAGAVNNLIAILHGAGQPAKAMEVLERAEREGLDEQLNLKLIEMVHRALGKPTEGILQENILSPENPSLEARRLALPFRREGSLEPPVYENAYILFDRDSRQAVLFDPGIRDARIEAFVHEQKLNVRAVLLTHGHEDHIGAVRYYADLYGAPACIHAADAERLPDPPGRLVEDGDTLDFDGLRIRVLHTPGHSQGSVCYLAEGLLFSGDTLFRNNIGRVWPEEKMSAGQVRNALIESIQEKILPLAAETRICPGHGKITTLLRERSENPFLK